ncbi:MAG: MraY family glycosyltransferase [Sulfurovum sp.]|nr:MraY family glycosyltransferase [Sulfurovum sp.]
MLSFFVLIFMLSLLAIYVIRRYARVWGLIDIPNQRSIHISSMPKGAGIAFFIALVLAFFVFYVEIFFMYHWTIMAISLVFIIGLMDDNYTMSVKAKFIVIAFSTLLLSFDALIIQELGSFFGVPIRLFWLALPFTIFVVAGFTNALNLIDGLDGLATVISLIILGAFLWLGYVHEDSFIFIVSLTCIATLLAFLCFNWSPASIFMGDSGSLLLGFTMALLSIESLAYIPAIAILYIAAIPILDTLVVMLRRKYQGKGLCVADSCHLHHIVQYYFQGNTIKTVLFLGMIQSIYTCIGLQLLKGIDQGLWLCIFIVNIVLLYRTIQWTIKKEKIIC